MSDVTRILNAIEQGDGQAAERLLPLANDRFRKRTVVLGCATEGLKEAKLVMPSATPTSPPRSGNPLARVSQRARH